MVPHGGGCSSRNARIIATNDKRFQWQSCIHLLVVVAFFLQFIMMPGIYISGDVGCNDGPVLLARTLLPL